MDIIRRTPGISLLITDLVMPGLTGRELAMELEKIQPQSKVLFLSGYAPSAIVHQGVLEEGVPFLAKPFTPDALAFSATFIPTDFEVATFNLAFLSFSVDEADTMV